MKGQTSLLGIVLTPFVGNRRIPLATESLVCSCLISLCHSPQLAPILTQWKLSSPRTCTLLTRPEAHGLPNPHRIYGARTQDDSPTAPSPHTLAINCASETIISKTTSHTLRLHPSDRRSASACISSWSRALLFQQTPTILWSCLRQSCAFDSLSWYSYTLVEGRRLMVCYVLGISWLPGAEPRG